MGCVCVYFYHSISYRILQVAPMLSVLSQGLLCLPPLTCPSLLWSRSSSALTWPSERSSPFVILTVVVFELWVFLHLHYNWSDLLKTQILCICVCSLTQSCLTLCNPMSCSLLGSSVLEIFRARILEWVATSSFRRSSWPRDWTCVSCIGRWILCHWAT